MNGDRYKRLAIFILVLGSMLRLIALPGPKDEIFDEFHYIPAARVVVGLKPLVPDEKWKGVPLIYRSPDPNFSHPPLGKFLIGGGMRIFGDNPLGWRAAAVLFGILTIVMMVFSRRFIYDDQSTRGKEPESSSTINATVAIPAMLAAFFMAMEPMHLAQGRLGTLDVFLCFFSLGAFFGASRLARGESTWAALFYGLCASAAAMVKIVATVPMLLIGLIALGLRIFRRLDTKSIWRDIAIAIAGAGVGFALWIGFFMAHGYSLHEWVSYQFDVVERVGGNLPSHRYGSVFMEWLGNQRPVWYHFKRDEASMVHGMVAVGHPLLWVLFGWVIIRKVLLIIRGEFTFQVDAFLGVLLWLATLGFATAARQGFLYYVLPCVPLMCLAVAEEIFAFATTKPKKEEAPGTPTPTQICIGLIIVYAAFTIWLYPLIVALPIPEWWFRQYIWFTGV